MEPWEIEETFYVKRGWEPDKAHTCVVMRWMLHGDFRPLAAAIWAKEVDPDVLDLLAMLIDKGRVKLTLNRGGRPRKPEAQVRNILAGHYYATGQGSVAEIAKVLGIGEKSVSAAITAWRNSNK